MKLGDVCGEPQFLSGVINREGHGRELAEGNTDHGAERRAQRLAFNTVHLPRLVHEGLLGVQDAKTEVLLSSRAKWEKAWRHLWVFLGTRLPCLRPLSLWCMQSGMGHSCHELS